MGNCSRNYWEQNPARRLWWQALTTNTAKINPTVFVDVNAINGFNFYRVGLLPNP